VRGEVPKVQAELQASALTLDSFLPGSGRTAEGWGRDDLGFKALRGFDAEVTLETAALGYGPVTGVPARIALTLKEGKLDAGLALRTSDTGTATLSASIDAKPNPPVFALTAKADNGDPGLLLRATTGLDLLQGDGRFDLSLSAAGRTEEELLGTLNGSLNLDMAAGRLKGVNLEPLAGLLREKIVEGWSAVAGDTAITGLAGTVAVTDGIASLQTARLAMPSAVLEISGEVDLLRRGLDLKAGLRAPGDGGANLLPVPAIIRGPWAAPRIYPDVAGLLEDPAAGFAQLKAMPEAVAPAD
jgi:AsmA protein